MNPPQGAARNIFTPDDIKFIKAYAAHGAGDWRHAGRSVQDKARHRLGSWLAQDDRQAELERSREVTG